MNYRTSNRPVTHTLVLTLEDIVNLVSGKADLVFRNQEEGQCRESLATIPLGDVTVIGYKRSDATVEITDIRSLQFTWET